MIPLAKIVITKDLINVLNVKETYILKMVNHAHLLAILTNLEILQTINVNHVIQNVTLAQEKLIHAQDVQIRHFCMVINVYQIVLKIHSRTPIIIYANNVTLSVQHVLEFLKMNVFLVLTEHSLIMILLTVHPHANLNFMQTQLQKFVRIVFQIVTVALTTKFAKNALVDIILIL